MVPKQGPMKGSQNLVIIRSGRLRRISRPTFIQLKGLQELIFR